MPYDPTTANCYPNSAVLINKLGLRDDRTLMQAESYYSAMRLMELENGIKFENVDFDFYLSIHKYLFQDIYDWAGQIRTTNISKKGTCFCPYEFIRETGEAIFISLNIIIIIKMFQSGSFQAVLLSFLIVSIFFTLQRRQWKD